MIPTVVVFAEIIFIIIIICYVPNLIVTKFLFLGTLHKPIVVKKDISE